MMNNDREASGAEGYRLGPEARVVLHRHGARRAYAIGVIVDEGPYSLSRARQVQAELMEAQGGFVTKATAALRLGVTERQIDYLRESGHLASERTETGHVLISVDSLTAEIERRSGE